MKLLDGRELADYIKERQAGQVRALRQAWNIFPKLAIVRANDSPVIDTYIRLKQAYAEDILIDVDVIETDAEHIIEVIEALNNDETVHGIIVQLPLADDSKTDAAIAAIDPSKDIDGLGENAPYSPATALAIDWLLAGYNVELKNKEIAIVGLGRLVGRPLVRLWQTTGYNVSTYDDSTEDLKGELRKADVIITATGVPGLIKSQMVKPGAAIVDAGTASEGGKIVGDVDPELRERNDLTITPEKGGVGPLTVTALFDNVIQAARAVADKQAN